MMKIDSFRILNLIFCIIIGVSGYTQPLTVETTLGNTQTCPRSNLIVPVRVINMISVDSFLLTLNYDQSVLTYASFRSVNSQLLSGTIHISDQPGTITISWRGNSAATILNDSIVELMFVTKSGKTRSVRQG